VKLLARIAGLLLLAGATAYALRLCVLEPFRCAHAASLGAAALAADERQSDYAARRLANGVRTSLHGCECVRPTDVEIPFTLAGASTTLGDSRSAAIEYERALAIERRPEIYFGLGMAQLDMLQRSAAIENLTRACAFDPARLANIPYPEVSGEIRRRLRAAYGPDWAP